VTAKFLLDTNVVSEPLKPNPNAVLISHLTSHETELALPAIVWHELMFGCYLLPESKKRANINDYLTTKLWDILPYDATAAVWHAAERARLTNLGKTPPFNDGQIAAIAATAGLTLVTFNVRDFNSFKGLRIVDWRH
jgi:tRNA(fMet)-specific endonuclease VapC